MRTFKKILAAMLACTMLLSAGAALAEGETVTINFWHHYSAQSAENETLMNVLIPAFEAENPGIKVNAVSHEWAELHDKVLVSANSNALPDVARCDIAWLPEFQKMGILVALDEEMPNFAEVSGKLLDSAMSTAIINGHYYALALNTNSKIVFYNKAMLEAAGVSIPATMEEWIEAVKKLSGEMVIDGYKIQPVATSVIKMRDDPRHPSTVLRMELYEGRNRQIRKMCDICGLEVKRLTRVAIGDLRLANLKPGEWRHLTKSQVAYLKDIK